MGLSLRSVSSSGSNNVEPNVCYPGIVEQGAFDLKLGNKIRALQCLERQFTAEDAEVAEIFF